MPNLYAAFISHASEDHDLAQLFHDLLRDLHLRSFLASAELERQSEGGGWRESLREGIPNSSTFVPIYTPRSISREWVLFEAGMAEASSLRRFSARTASVAHEDIHRTGTDVQVFDLFREESLVNLITSIWCGHHGEADRSAERNVIKHQFSIPGIRERVDALLHKASMRWVFIAGNGLVNETDKDSGEQQKHKKKRRKQDRPTALEQWVKGFATELREREVNVMSCPQVTSVGLVVATVYADAQADSEGEVHRYRVGGLHPIDRALGQPSSAGEDEMDSKTLANWRLHLKKFRQEYLRDVEWLVLIGGAQGTNEEWKAAEELGKRIMPIPFFGGTGFKAWRKMSADERPFASWSEGDDPIEPAVAAELILNG